jgi:two-component system phosphate regulon sensor histidine kinase PhoR
MPETLPAILALSSEAILTVDEDYIIQETNPAFGRVTGWTGTTPVRRRCSDVFRCRDTRKSLLCGTARCPLTEAFASSEAPPVRDLSWETRGGALCDVSATFTARRERDGRHAVIVARDVTALNAANRMRANFISMVSHELRTPLNTINGFLEIVLDGQVGPLNERQQEFLEYAHISTQQLATLVEDILFISKADSGQFTLRRGEVPVAKLIAQVLNSLQAVAEKAEVRLVADVAASLPTIPADELRLQQVLTNLLNNAIKFSAARSEVTLTVRAEGDELVFTVADRGKGIAAEDHQRIFERFYQSEGGARARAGGYGLGLSIAKLIVEQHGGRIWVESALGEGATFAFTMPTLTMRGPGHALEV